jgi:hypothetical protein
MTQANDGDGRRLIHERQVKCRGYLRADGLWDIEASLADVKTHAVPLAEGRIVEAGEAYHGMWLRLTVDDQFTICAVAVRMPEVPTSECRGAMPVYQQLVGLRIEPGFTRTIKRMFGGIQGCVHLTEVLMPIATTAFQTIPLGRALAAPRSPQDAEGLPRTLAALVNTCHALRASGPLAERLLEKRQIGPL